MADANDVLVDTDESSSSSSSKSEATDIESESSYEDDEEEELLGRSLLWLCREDQFKAAGKRLSRLLEENNVDQLKQEVFEKDRHDGTYMMHELCSSLCDVEDSMFQQLHEFCLRFPVEYRTVLMTQPRSSHRRTPLHWAGFHQSSFDNIVKPLARACPEALGLLDDAGRTPFGVFGRCYWKAVSHAADVVKTTILSRHDHDAFKKLGLSWEHHLVRMEVHKCAVRYFVTYQLEPFSDQHRKERAGKMKSQFWTTLSILGYFQERNKDLVIKILSYVGYNTKQVGKKRKR